MCLSPPSKCNTVGITARNPSFKWPGALGEQFLLVTQLGLSLCSGPAEDNSIFIISLEGFIDLKGFRLPAPVFRSTLGFGWAVLNSPFHLWNSVSATNYNCLPSRKSILPKPCVPRGKSKAEAAGCKAVSNPNFLCLCPLWPPGVMKVEERGWTSLSSQDGTVGCNIIYNIIL